MATNARKSQLAGMILIAMTGAVVYSTRKSPQVSLPVHQLLDIYGFSAGECLPLLAHPNSPEGYPFTGLWPPAAGKPQEGLSLFESGMIRFFLSAPADLVAALELTGPEAELSQVKAWIPRSDSGGSSLELRRSTNPDTHAAVLNLVIPKSLTCVGENRLQVSGPTSLKLTTVLFESQIGLGRDREDVVVPFGHSLLIPLAPDSPVPTAIEWQRMRPELKPGVASVPEATLKLSYHGEEEWNGRENRFSSVSLGSKGSTKFTTSGVSGRFRCIRLEAQSSGRPLPGQLGLRVERPILHLPKLTSLHSNSKPDSDTTAVSGSKEPDPTPPWSNSPSNIKPGQAPRVEKGKCNVLIVLVDTLRADHLGCYGGQTPKSLTPQLDNFAQSATLFRHCWAQAPWTKPSVASILTGRYPWEHGAEDFADIISDKVPNLAQILSPVGYHCGGVVTNYFVSEVFGFGRGFSSYSCSIAESFRGVNAKAKSWLARRTDKGPFFLYLHCLEPHAPYEPPTDLKGYENGPQFSNKELVELTGLSSRQRLRRGSAAEDRQIEQMLKKAHQAYAGEVAAADRAFGELLAELKAKNLFEDTLIVFVSDHGEEFLEHGWLGHVNTLYPEVIQVPLIIKFPRQRQGAVVEESVQQIDILPTVLSACGVEPPGHLPGRAFSAEGKVKEVAGPIYYRLHAGKDAQRFGQGPDRWANILGVHYCGWDFHQCLASNQSATIPPLELFQVLQDPQEQFNQIFKCLGPQAYLQHLLTRASWSDAPANNNVLKLEDQRELEQQLRSLQYVR